MTRIRWALVRLYEQIGMPGCLSIGLIGATLVFFFSALSPLERQVQAAQALYQKQQVNHARAAMLRLAESRSPSVQYGSFLRFFEKTDSMSDQLMTIHRAAQTVGLQLGSADYQVADAHDLPLQELRITLPLSGPYISVRQFLAAVLEQIPTAAVEELRFQRPRIDSMTLDAEVHLTVFMPPRT